MGDMYFGSKSRSARFDHEEREEKAEAYENTHENRMARVNMPKEARPALPIEVSLREQNASIDMLEAALSTLWDTLVPMLGDEYADSPGTISEDKSAPHSPITGIIESNSNRIDRFTYQIRSITNRLGG